jgi:hypothetical protein
MEGNDVRRLEAAGGSADEIVYLRYLAPLRAGGSGESDGSAGCRSRIEKAGWALKVCRDVRC